MHPHASLLGLLAATTLVVAAPAPQMTSTIKSTTVQTITSCSGSSPCPPVAQTSCSTSCSQPPAPPSASTSSSCTSSSSVHSYPASSSTICSSSSTLASCTTCAPTTVTGPGSTYTAPASTVYSTVVSGTTLSYTAPGTTLTAPGRNVTWTAPGPTMTSVVVSGTTMHHTYSVPGPGVTQTMPGTTMTAPAVTVTAPGTTKTAPGITVFCTVVSGVTTSFTATLTAPPVVLTTTAPGSTVVSGTTVYAPGTTVSAPNVTVTAPASTVVSVKTCISGTTFYAPGTTIISSMTQYAPGTTVTAPPMPSPTEDCDTCTEGSECSSCPSVDVDVDVDVMIGGCEQGDSKCARKSKAAHAAAASAVQKVARSDAGDMHSMVRRKHHHKKSSSSSSSSDYMTESYSDSPSSTSTGYSSGSAKAAYPFGKASDTKPTSSQAATSTKIGSDDVQYSSTETVWVDATAKPEIFARKWTHCHGHKHVTTTESPVLTGIPYTTFTPIIAADLTATSTSTTTLYQTASPTDTSEVINSDSTEDEMDDMYVEDGSDEPETASESTETVFETTEPAPESIETASESTETATESTLEPDTEATAEATTTVFSTSTADAAPTDSEVAAESTTFTEASTAAPTETDPATESTTTTVPEDATSTQMVIDVRSITRETPISHAEELQDLADDAYETWQEEHDAFLSLEAKNNYDPFDENMAKIMHTMNKVDSFTEENAEELQELAWKAAEDEGITVADAPVKPTGDYDIGDTRSNIIGRSIPDKGTSEPITAGGSCPKNSNKLCDGSGTPEHCVCYFDTDDGCPSGERKLCDGFGKNCHCVAPKALKRSLKRVAAEPTTTNDKTCPSGEVRACEKNESGDEACYCLKQSADLEDLKDEHKDDEMVQRRDGPVVPPFKDYEDFINKTTFGFCKSGKFSFETSELARHSPQKECPDEASPTVASGICTCPRTLPDPFITMNGPLRGSTIDDPPKGKKHGETEDKKHDMTKDKEHSRLKGRGGPPFPPPALPIRPQPRKPLTPEQKQFKIKQFQDCEGRKGTRRCMIEWEEFEARVDDFRSCFLSKGRDECLKDYNEKMWRCAKRRGQKWCRDHEYDTSHGELSLGEICGHPPTLMYCQSGILLPPSRQHGPRMPSFMKDANKSVTPKPQDQDDEADSVDVVKAAGKSDDEDAVREALGGKPPTKAETKAAKKKEKPIESSDDEVTVRVEIGLNTTGGFKPKKVVEDAEKIEKALGTGLTQEESEFSPPRDSDDGTSTHDTKRSLLVTGHESLEHTIWDVLEEVDEEFAVVEKRFHDRISHPGTPFPLGDDIDELEFQMRPPRAVKRDILEDVPDADDLANEEADAGHMERRLPRKGPVRCAQADGDDCLHHGPPLTPPPFTPTEDVEDMFDERDLSSDVTVADSAEPTKAVIVTRATITPAAQISQRTDKHQAEQDKIDASRSSSYAADSSSFSLFAASELAESVKAGILPVSMQTGPNGPFDITGVDNGEKSMASSVMSVYATMTAPDLGLYSATRRLVEDPATTRAVDHLDRYMRPMRIKKEYEASRAEVSYQATRTDGPYGIFRAQYPEDADSEICEMFPGYMWYYGHCAQVGAEQIAEMRGEGKKEEDEEDEEEGQLIARGDGGSRTKPDIVEDHIDDGEAQQEARCREKGLVWITEGGFTHCEDPALPDNEDSENEDEDFPSKPLERRQLPFGDRFHHAHQEQQDTAKMYCQADGGTWNPHLGPLGYCKRPPKNETDVWVQPMSPRPCLEWSKKHGKCNQWAPSSTCSLKCVRKGKKSGACLTYEPIRCPQWKMDLSDEPPTNEILSTRSDDDDSDDEDDSNQSEQVDVLARRNQYDPTPYNVVPPPRQQDDEFSTTPLNGKPASPYNDSPAPRPASTTGMEPHQGRKLWPTLPNQPEPVAPEEAWQPAGPYEDVPTSTEVEAALDHGRDTLATKIKRYLGDYVWDNGKMHELPKVVYPTNNTHHTDNKVSPHETCVGEGLHRECVDTKCKQSIFSQNCRFPWTKGCKNWSPCVDANFKGAPPFGPTILPVPEQGVVVGETAEEEEKRKHHDERGQLVDGVAAPEPVVSATVLPPSARFYKRRVGKVDRIDQTNEMFKGASDNDGEIAPVAHLDRRHFHKHLDIDIDTTNPLGNNMTDWPSNPANPDSPSYVPPDSPLPESYTMEPHYGWADWNQSSYYWYTTICDSTPSFPGGHPDCKNPLINHQVLATIRCRPKCLSYGRNNQMERQHCTIYGDTEAGCEGVGLPIPPVNTGYWTLWASGDPVRQALLTRYPNDRMVGNVRPERGRAGWEERMNGGGELEGKEVEWVGLVEEDMRWIRGGGGGGEETKEEKGEEAKVEGEGEME